jgi:hypothetical protein
MAVFKCFFYTALVSTIFFMGTHNRICSSPRDENPDPSLPACFVNHGGSLERLLDYVSPLHVQIPFLLDVILVTDPNQILLVANSSEVTRFPSSAKQKIPALLQTTNLFHLNATGKFGSDDSSWWTAFDSTPAPAKESLASSSDPPARGYDEAELEAVVKALRDSDHGLGQALTGLGASRGLEPGLMSRLLSSDATSLLHQAHMTCNLMNSPPDVAHKDLKEHGCMSLKNLAQAVFLHHSSGGASDTLPDVLLQQTSHAVVPRYVTCPTELQGLLWNPAEEGTPLLLFVGRAARLTRDARFVYGDNEGAGAFFQTFAEDVFSRLDAETGPGGFPSSGQKMEL